MAGKKNHIIPKWLQKGFASRVNGENVFTWAYRKNSEPFETNTDNSIVENYFFGKKGELNADDEMTDIEAYKLSPLMNKLRDESLDFANLKTEIAELVAHFSIRTKFIRESFTKISKQMIGGMKEILTNEDNIENVMLNPPTSFLEAQIDDVLENSKDEELTTAIEIFDLLGFEKEDVKKALTQLTKSFLSNEETKNEIGDSLKELFSQTFDESNPLYPQSIREGHNKSLAENTIPLTRVKKYEEFDWFVYNTDSSVILGDEACIFRETGEKRFKPSCDIEKTAQVYLPISSNQILIGTDNQDEIEIDVKILNEAIARCSYEQFISSEKSDDKLSLIEFIGVDSYIASEEEVTKELDEIRNNFGMMFEAE